MADKKKTLIRKSRGRKFKGWMCSGYGIFPNSKKCHGCPDCKPKKFY